MRQPLICRAHTYLPEVLTILKDRIYCITVKCSVREADRSCHSYSDDGTAASTEICNGAWANLTTTSLVYFVMVFMGMSVAEVMCVCHL